MSQAQSSLPQDSLIPVGVSSCLLGEEVRYDGSHKRDRFITDKLSSYLEFVPICPEVAIGMSIPRPPIRLELVEGEVRLRGVRDSCVDVTEPIGEYSSAISSAIDNLSGYILKSKSPSCGMERVKVYKPDGNLAGFSSPGMYARRLLERYPLLPVEEDGRLNDPALRDSFICRVFAYHRWRQLCAAGLKRDDIVQFHAEHKLLIMAHDEQRMRRLGKLVGSLGKEDLDAAAQEYIKEFMAALAQPATRKRHVNVLQHLLGYLKRDLAPDDKREVLNVIDQYRLGMIPLIVPITLLRHHFRRIRVPYVERQLYLYWSPPELALQNEL
ncbi:Hypothetical protein YbgA [Halorhodospira halochloris]|uniref:DUF1722 domain-containing protein n=1 Tax=Halorhodospira halochloris TaxID=1052 RepID=A0A0X8XAV9_HALHR|nr:DUF523 and DUF1722 domain-containing protein [Halorhodospira halochloris]MBK1651927.1 hypothetical protein [Halorhodospira halochloris]BAU58217.1 Hypothetical protein YbgA [Halorhodospira halochloris]